MIRKVMSLAFALMAMLSVSAQMPQLTPLPLNPKVTHGVLPNGLSYYIMHNEMPKERANFYIAQKVGSTLETQEQLGLAHFLEHMAFNGTSHYPGKNMLNYLQGKGIRFGEDINAYTYFDETVYNINNVPTTDKPLMDSVLLVLHDWSGEILLEEAEIDAERGVIQEEWRSRNDANNRMYEAILPQIYQEYQYQQTPIGKMEVVMNFKPEVLRAYYKKWYRPDQQGIVIVGDIDVDDMEKKVIDLFSQIPMPENAAPREYPTVSDNEKPIYVAFSDPELRMPRTTISFKSDKVPFEMRNTQEIFVGENLLKSIIQQLINNRISEAAHEPNCTFSQAGVYFGDFYVSKTKDSFNIVVIPKTGTQAAVAEIMGIVTRACKTGFTESEYDRVKEEMLSQLEMAYNERDKTDNDALASGIIRHFVDNEPNPGIETEFEMVKAILPNIPVMAINQVCSQLLSDNNMVIVTAEPQREGFEIVAEEVMVKTVTDAMHAQYEAYVDEVITEPLIANLPKPGTIKSVTEDKSIGAQIFTLSNGVKVVLKTTDFAADEVLLTAFREGGRRSYNQADAANVALMGLAFSSSKMGPFDRKTLDKYLAGKQANVGFTINSYTDVLSGFSTVKDLPTMMELVYTAFTNLGMDQATYDVNEGRNRVILQNAASNPEKIFSDVLAATQYPDNALMQGITVATLDNANYAKMLEMVKAALSNAADYTFVFTGNVDEAAIRPLLEQYIATLPAAGPRKVNTVSPISTAKGDVVKHFNQVMQTPSTIVEDIYTDNNVPFNQKNDIMVEMVGDILDNIYTETLREEEGGTYGAAVGAYINPNDGYWSLIYKFQTNKDQQQSLIDRAQAELMKLLNEGTNEEQFNKVKQAMIKQIEINVRTNQYWNSNLMTYLRGFDVITDYQKTIESITLADLNKFMKGLYNGKNRIQVIMEGVAE
ncbi:MAG: insulinase family protein [Muribaculaceae bacterium]|nr:insulinase family protein [Muribaculaceae bacterium]